MAKQFRPLKDRERKILNTFLKKEFPGRKEIIEQIDKSLVRNIEEYDDKWGSIEFRTSSPHKAVVESRIPVQGLVNDEDGIPIELFLHVVEGSVNELEIVRADNSPIINLDPAKIKAITYDEIEKE